MPRDSTGQHRDPLLGDRGRASPILPAGDPGAGFRPLPCARPAAPARPRSRARRGLPPYLLRTPGPADGRVLAPSMPPRAGRTPGPRVSHTPPGEPGAYGRSRHGDPGAVRRLLARAAAVPVSPGPPPRYCHLALSPLRPGDRHPRPGRDPALRQGEAHHFWSESNPWPRSHLRISGPLAAATRAAGGPGADGDAAPTAAARARSAWCSAMAAWPVICPCWRCWS